MTARRCGRTRLKSELRTACRRVARSDAGLVRATTVTDAAGGDPAVVVCLATPATADSAVIADELTVAKGFALPVLPVVRAGASVPASLAAGIRRLPPQPGTTGRRSASRCFVPSGSPKRNEGSSSHTAGGDKRPGIAATACVGGSIVRRVLGPLQRATGGRFPAPHQRGVIGQSVCPPSRECRSCGLRSGATQRRTR